MLSNVTIDIDSDILYKVILCIGIFLLGLLILFITFIIVKRNHKAEVVVNTVDDKINRLYFLYQTKQITETELKYALDKLIEEGKQDDKDN